MGCDGSHHYSANPHAQIKPLAEGAHPEPATLGSKTVDGEGAQPWLRKANAETVKAYS